MQKNDVEFQERTQVCDAAQSVAHVFSEYRWFAHMWSTYAYLLIKHPSVANVHPSTQIDCFYGEYTTSLCAWCILPQIPAFAHLV